MPIDIHVVAVIGGDGHSFGMNDVGCRIFHVLAALSCHLMMWNMCGKYVEMWRCSLDQMVSRLMRFTKLYALLFIGPLIDG